MMKDWIYFDGVYIRTNSIHAVRLVDDKYISIMSAHMCYTQSFETNNHASVRFKELLEEIGEDDNS